MVLGYPLEHFVDDVASRITIEITSSRRLQLILKIAESSLRSS